MGLCLSKKDVLIQKPRQILHDHGRSFVPDSPASTSLISGDSSSIAEKQLLKNSSISSSNCTLGLNRSSVYSNAAECGSRSSLGLGRFSSAAAAATFDDLDLDQSEARTSGFSYLSSPMIEGIDVSSSSGLDQSVARKRFELDGGLRGDPIDEELEEEEEEDFEMDECGLKKQKKKGMKMNTMTLKKKKKKGSQMKSLHVFGEVFGEMGRGRSTIPAIPTIRMASICETGTASAKQKGNSKIHSEELAVFGTEDHYLRSTNVFSKPKISMSSLSSSMRQDCGDSEDLMSEDSAQHTAARSARWGFWFDSSGSDEMEGEGDDEASRVSSCSTQIEPSICKMNGGPFFCDSSSPSSGKPAFMAVPPLWQQPSLNFSHMNPGSRAAAAAGNFFAKNHQNESVKIHTGMNRRRRSSEETISATTDSSEDSNLGLNLNSNLNSTMSRGGFVRGFAAMPLQGSLLRPKYNPPTGAATTGSFSSSSFTDESQDEDRMQNLQTNPKQAPAAAAAAAAATISKQDHDYDSDSSNDLFEIENLGATLGSLSSSSDKERFIYPMNSAFLKDPDITHTTTIKLAPTPARNFQFQSAHSRASGVASKGGVGILGPTLRANVALGKQLPRQGSDLLQGRKNFSWSRPQKKKTTANAATGHLENETSAFYEIR